MSADTGMVGATVAHRYELLERLGRGGMGDVYRAHDRELDEEIALKLVRRELLTLPGVLERFRAEVKLARRVTHRNVARTYELAHADELTFFTMELVAGQPLTEHMRTGPIPTALAIAIAVELCDALAAAHAVGVIHRDLKPDNVLLARDGRVVLTDFGVAAVSATTDLGTSGTPRYMAPEQLRGEPPTPLVDVYALGLVLYEMVTGRAAYAGTVAAIADAKHQEPDGPDLIGVEPAVATIIRRATAADPTRRWPSIDVMRLALAPDHRDLPVAPVGGPHRTELRLPTVVLTPPRAAAGVAHLAHGFHHELAARLSRRRHLRLHRRTSPVLEGRVAQVDLELGAIAEVRVRFGDRVGELTLTLPAEVEALVDGAALASQVIAGAIGAGAEREATDPPMPPAALVHVWRAGVELQRGQAERAAAHAEFLAAAAIAPDDPRVRAGLAMCEVRAAFFRAGVEPRALVAAETHAMAAVHAAPYLAEAQIAAGHVRLHLGDVNGAAVHFRTAIARAPHLAESHEWLGRMLLEAGFLVDGLARVGDAIDMEPELEAPRWDRVRAYALEERWDEYAAALDELAALTGGLPGRWGWRLRLASWRGDRRAIAAVRAEVAAAEGAPAFERDFILVVCDALLGGDWDAARSGMTARALAPEAGSPRRRAFVAQILAEVAGAVGDRDGALQLLEIAVEHGLFDRHWLERCPHLAALREAPRYLAAHAVVAARAEAVLDALYGDHASRATAATMLHTTAAR